MKSITHIIITHLAFLIIFGGAAIAFAQSDNGNSGTQNKAVTSEIKNEMQEQIIEKKGVAAENGQLHRVQLQEKAQERVTNLAANMSNRIDAAIERLQNIIDRLSSRIEKISEQGIDTSEAEAALALAQISIDTASEAISNIDSDVANAVESEDIYTDWLEVKTTITEVKDNLKTAQTELRASVSALKMGLLQTTENNGVSEAVKTQQQNETPELEELE